MRRWRRGIPRDNGPSRNGLKAVTCSKAAEVFARMGHESSDIPSTIVSYRFEISNYLICKLQSNKSVFPIADSQQSSNAFSPEHATQSRSPFSPSFSPTVGSSSSHHSNHNISSFSNIGNLSTMSPATLSSANHHHLTGIHHTPTGVSASANHSMIGLMGNSVGNNSMSLNPTLTDMQMTRLAAVAEEYEINIVVSNKQL